MPTVKANQDAIQDNNKYPALTAHTGTAGTALVVRVVANSSGQIGVYGTVETGASVTVGTIDEITNIVGGTLSTSSTTGINTFGSTGSIDDNTTGTIVSYITPAGFKLRGFMASGEGQGYYYLQIGAGTTKYAYRTSIADKNAQVILPNPETIASSTNLFLKVDNENSSTVNYEGAIIGE